MTRSSLSVAFVILSVAALTGTATAQEAGAGSLSVQSPWSRATPGGAKVGAGYLAIDNKGAAPDRLIGVSSEIAGRTEIHETTVEGAVARMRPVESVEIRPGARAELKPGGSHVMFMDLRRPLKEGERFKATLQFERAGPVTVEFTVRGIGAAHGGRHSH
jgi:periplasmic copper chaperone A